MKSEDCKRFDECSAPICPLNDGSLNNGTWYPEENVCMLQVFCHKPWIRNQKKIARKVRNKDLYFTLEMLSRNCVITLATEGLDPDHDISEMREDEVRWLKQHPEKPKLSEAKKKELRNRMMKVRQVLNPSEKDSNGIENLSFKRESAL